MSVGLSQRASKEDFMRAMGLDPSDARHEGIYRAMRDEAIRTYNILNSDRSNLAEDKQNDPSVNPPYFWHHISPEKRQWAALRTWQGAPAGSIQRQLFDRGATAGEHAPNWVTNWLLYSVFRSRDTRNNRNRRAGGSEGSSSSGNSNSDQRTTSRMYDQVRNVHRPR